MGLEVAVGSTPAAVRSARLAKELAWASADKPMFCVVSPIAPPRLWRVVADGVRSATETAFVETPGGTAALERAVAAGAQHLARLSSALIEPHLRLDAQLAAMVVSGDKAHIAVSSGMRVYRARNGEPQRLMNHGNRSPGISHGGLHVSTERLLRGDLFVFGSRDGFAMPSIGAMATTLAQRPEAPAKDLCDAMLRSCRSASVSAGVVVLRVR